MATIETMGDQYKLSKEYLGRGAFGVVRKARSVRTGMVCAIKQVVKVFDQPGMTRRVLREMRVLSMVQHSSLVQLIDLKYQGEALYFVTECCETDLHSLMHKDKSRYYENSVGMSARVSIMHQVLLGLQHLHSFAIAHRDIKPSNILLTSDLQAKICDFGLARQITTKSADMSVLHDESMVFGNNDPMTPYVVTRWYRAPEVVITEGVYQLKQDIWAGGCVFAEMMSGKVLFPGRDTVHQMHLIVAGLGRPTAADVNFPGVSPGTIAWFQTLHGEECLSEILSSPFWDALHVTNLPAKRHFLQLLRGMLQFNPQNRLSAVKATTCPIFNHCSSPDIEDEREDSWRDEGQLNDIEACPPSHRALREMVLADANEIQMKHVWRDVHEKDDLARRIRLSRAGLQQSPDDDKMSQKPLSRESGALRVSSGCTTHESIETTESATCAISSSGSDIVEVVEEEQDCSRFYVSPGPNRQEETATATATATSVDTDDDCEIFHDIVASSKPTSGVLAQIRSSVGSLSALMRSSTEGVKRQRSRSLRRLDGMK